MGHYMQCDKTVVNFVDPDRNKPRGDARESTAGEFPERILLVLLEIVATVRAADHLA